jgi:hypothetical protein
MFPGAGLRPKVIPPKVVPPKVVPPKVVSATVFRARARRSTPLHFMTAQFGESVRGTMGAQKLWI